jgi:hypothetical protein
MSEQMSLNRAFDNIAAENLHAEEARQLTPEEERQGQEEWKAYLGSRPASEGEAHTSEGDDSTNAGEYFDAKRKDHYDRTMHDPAELSPTKLFDRYISAEIKGNRTFVEDYGHALAEKLDDKELTVTQLAELQAEAEFESEITESGAPRTAALVSEAIDRRITTFHEAGEKRAIELHNSNLGKKAGEKENYQVRGNGENGQMRDVTLLEDAAIRTDSFRSRIERAKEKYLAELREDEAERTTQRIPLPAVNGADLNELDPAKEEAEDETKELAFGEGDMVKVRRSSGKIEDNWKVLHFSDDEDQRVRVVRDDGPDNPGKAIIKDIPLAELEELNPLSEEADEEMEKYLRMLEEARARDHDEGEEGEDDWDEDEAAEEPEKTEEAAFVSGWKMLKNRAKRIFDKAAERANSGNETHQRVAAKVLGALATGGSASLMFVQEVKDPYGGLPPEEVEKEEARAA